MTLPRLSRGWRTATTVGLIVTVVGGVAYAADRQGDEGTPREDARERPAQLRDTIIPASEPGEQPIVVTRGANKYASRWPTCTPAEVAVRVRDFTQALASGDEEAMREYWAPNPEWGRDFKWFNIVPRSERPWGVGIDSPEEGIALLREWGGIRVRVRRLAVADPGPPDLGEGGAALDATFRPPPHTGARKKVIGGKMAIACTGPEIPVFATGVRKRFGIARCPKPDSGVPRSVRRTAMIVCSYGS